MPESRVAKCTLLPAVLALVSAGCGEAVRPVLGNLKIGPAADGPFVMPVLINETSPFEYPYDAWERGVGGEAVLRIHISSSGVVDSVVIAQSSGDLTLDSAAVTDARELRYEPAEQGERKVSVWAYLPVRYPLPSRASEDGGPM